jgi:hypothetical protein
MLLEKVVECFSQKVLYRAVRVKGHLLELLRNTGINVTDEGFLAGAAGGLGGIRHPLFFPVMASRRSAGGVAMAVGARSKVGVRRPVTAFCSCGLSLLGMFITCNHASMFTCKRVKGADFLRGDAVGLEFNGGLAPRPACQPATAVIPMAK